MYPYTIVIRNPARELRRRFDRVLNKLDIVSALGMLGVGLSCLATTALENKAAP